ncbi:Hypothetical protein CAP_0412 [Chondromyces apiculatus DSM 436]|uniref:Uncharacterized protein n=1 Tax=Chondromyces apiculatus DSM 436 TaxID=1192034 RepID=A0A017SV29_9BACT|nr:Hypothetical protein CAP_0412 [Chondromyces apiculatus DSM 436]
MHLIRVLRRDPPVEPLQRRLHRCHRVGVEQLPHLRLAEQLPQPALIDGQRLRPPLRERQIPLVHERPHVREQERRRERRRHPRVHRHHAHLAALDPPQKLLQRRQIEHVPQTLPVRLQQHRECAVARRHRQQVCCPLPLLPEWCALPGHPPRQEQRPPRALPEARREHRRPSQVRHQQVLHLVHLRQELVRIQRLRRLRQPDHHPVVGPVRLDLQPQLRLRPRHHARRQRRVHPPPERRQDAHPQVAHLVLEALHHHRPVARHLPRRRCLLVHVPHQPLCRSRIEPVLLAQQRLCLPFPQPCQRPRQRPDRRPQLRRSPHLIAAPERHLPRLPWRRHHHHPIMGDLRDPPRRRPEQEDLSFPRLEHHLLVQLPHAPACLPCRLVRRQEHPVQPPVRDGPCVHHRQPLRPLAPAHQAPHAVPHDARPQLRELVRRIAPAEHVEHPLEAAPRQLRERRRLAHQLEERVHVDRVHRRDRHDLLRQHVERAARIARLLDAPLPHQRRRRRAREQIPPVLREDDPPRRPPHLVPRAPDTLQPRRHRRRRLDLHHQLHRPEIQPELQRRRGDDARQRPRLELLLDRLPLLARDGPVVRPRDHLPREIVQRRREPLREPPAVREDHGRAVRAHQLHEPRVDARPGRGRARRRRGNAPRRPTEQRHLHPHRRRRAHHLPLRIPDDGLARLLA